MTGEVPGLPHQRTARDLDFDPCEYVSPACTHRQHDACDDGCRYCGSLCLCVCHRWRVPIYGVPVKTA